VLAERDGEKGGGTASEFVRKCAFISSDERVGGKEGGGGELLEFRSRKASVTVRAGQGRTAHTRNRSPLFHELFEGYL